MFLPGKKLYNESELLSLIAKGDEIAFGKFYHYTSRGIYNAVMVYLKDHETAREIVQIIYIGIWDKRESPVCSTQFEGLFVYSCA